MYGDSPCQAHRELCESAQFFFLYLFLLFVISIANVTPGFWFHIVLFTCFSNDIERFLFHIKAFHHTNSAIHPSTIEIIAHKDNLCPWFQKKVFRGRQTTIGEVTHNLSLEDGRIAR